MIVIIIFIKHTVSWTIDERLEGDEAIAVG